MAWIQRSGILLGRADVLWLAVSRRSILIAMCEEGFIAVSKNVLKILSIDRLGQVFNERSMGLQFTPRELAVHPETKSLVVVESDAMSQPLTQQAPDGNAMDTDGTRQQTRSADMWENIPVRRASGARAYGSSIRAP
jgi:hypothetical protein